MKTFIFSSILTIASLSFAYSSSSNQTNWVVVTPSQKKVLNSDSCARAALDAATSLFSEEIREAGVDYPDHLYLAELHVSRPGNYYAITFKGDTSILVQTRRYGNGCKAYKPSRIGVE